MTEDLANGASRSDAVGRRYLTLVFSDLSDSTELAEAMEAEDYAELLGCLHKLYQATVANHGGIIVRIQGDGMLAIFGYPSAQEDDGRRAVDASLDLREAVQHLSLSFVKQPWSPLGVHTGIHSGLVLLSDGDVIRGRFELHGHAPSVAARLSGAARKNEILVSEETLGPENHFYLIGERRALMLKGKTEPLIVLEVTARAPIHTRFEASLQRGLAVFTGRQGELEMLKVLLSETLSGTPGHALLLGPPGIGKTRLSHEFLQYASSCGCEVHRGYCEPNLSAAPLQPFLHILRHIYGVDHGNPMETAGAQRTLSSANANAIRQAVAPVPALSSYLSADSLLEGQPQSIRNSTVSIPAMFEALASKAPQVIFIDDWQWADDASRQMVRALRAMRDRPIFILNTARSFAANDAGMIGTQVIELSPFTDAEAAQAVAQLLPGGNPFTAEQIRTRAGGNPLFIEELCHAVSNDAAKPWTAIASKGPAWLSTLIEARLDRLSHEHAALVRSAAVIGNVIPTWLFEEITGFGEHHVKVKALALLDFIYPSDTPGFLQFKHGVARDVIYESVGLQQRKATHLRIAEALLRKGSESGKEDLYEPLAYHYGAGGNAKEASTYAALAGDKAVAASALDRAQQHYRAALDALDQTEQPEAGYSTWMQITMRRSLACVFDPAREHLEILQRALDRSSARNDLEMLAQTEYWLGYVNYALGEARIAIPHLEQASILLTRVANGPMAMQVVATLGQAKAATGFYAEALTLLDRAIAEKRTHRKSGRPAVGSAYSLACKAAVLGDQGNFLQAYECFDEGLLAVKGAGHEVEGSILCWKSGVQLWQGEWAAAQESARLAMLVAQRVKSLYVYSMSISLEAFARWKITQSTDVLSRIADSTSWLEVGDRGLFISLNYGWLTEGLVADGQMARARHFAALSLLRARKKHDRLGQAMACRAMAVAMNTVGKRDAARRYLVRATQTAEIRGSLHELAVTALCVAELKIEWGDRVEAMQLLDKSQRQFDDMHMHWHAALAAQIRDKA